MTELVRSTPGKRVRPQGPAGSSPALSAKVCRSEHSVFNKTLLRICFFIIIFLILDLLSGKFEFQIFFQKEVVL